MRFKHINSVTTDKTCNCLLPNVLNLSNGPQQSFFSASYQLERKEDNCDEPVHSGDIGCYSSLDEPYKSKGEFEYHGIANPKLGFPGVFDLTWVSSDHFTMEESLEDPSFLLQAACTDGTVQIYHPRTLQCIRKFKISDTMLTSCSTFFSKSFIEYPNDENGKSISPGALLLCTAHTGKILLYSVTEERTILELDAHDYDAWCSAVIPRNPSAIEFIQDENDFRSDNFLLLTGGDDGFMKAFDLRVAASKATGKMRFNSGVVSITPVVMGAEPTGVKAYSEFLQPSPYILVGSYDETLSLVDTRFLKKPIATRNEFGGGVWRCSRMLFPPSNGKQCTNPSNPTLAPLSYVTGKNILAVPVMQRGLAWIAYDVKSAEVFGPISHLNDDGTHDSVNPLRSNALVYDCAILETKTFADEPNAEATFVTCDFYNKKIDLWSATDIEFPNWNA